MGKHFEFADFVDEFRVDFTVYEKSEGRYEQGRWIEGTETPQPMGGIILPLSNDELQFENNGVYTSLDRKVYTTDPLAKGQRIEHKGQSYTIHSEKPYSEYADVYIYFAKGVNG